MGVPFRFRRCGGVDRCVFTAIIASLIAICTIIVMIVPPCVILIRISEAVRLFQAADSALDFHLFDCPVWVDVILREANRAKEMANTFPN